MIKDHGVREQMSTGSVRDTQVGKPRFDLVPWTVIIQLALHFSKGAIKYDDNNWRKGQKTLRFFGSACRHMIAWLLMRRDEDHLIAAIWNLVCLYWTLQAIKVGELPEELDNRSVVDAKIAEGIYEQVEAWISNYLKEENNGTK